MTVEKHFIPPQTDNLDPEIKGLIEALFSPDGATQKTVLNTEQVLKLGIAKAFAEMYSIPELNTLCDYFMQLKISEKGRGRKDLVAALQTRKTEDDEQVRIKNQRNRLVGSDR